MKMIPIILLIAIVSTLDAQITITHQEIDKDVNPAADVEMHYSNTGFAIHDFFISDKYTLLFNSFLQAFYLLDNQTYLIKDQLWLKDISGLKHTKRHLPSAIGFNGSQGSYKSYLTPNSIFSSTDIQSKVNDSLLVVGSVSSSHTKHYMFHVGWTGKGTLFYEMIALPVEEDFARPDFSVKFKFNRYYKNLIVACYPHINPNYILLNFGAFYKFTIDQRYKKKPSVPVIYANNDKGLYDVAHVFEKLKVPISIFYSTKLFLIDKFEASKIYKIKGSTVESIDPPGINYYNHLTVDNYTNKLYLIGSVFYVNDSSKTCHRQQFMRFENGCEDHYKNKFDFDIYEFDSINNAFNVKYFVSLSGQLSELMQTTNLFFKDMKFKIHKHTLYFNIPIHSVNNVGGIYSIKLPKNIDTLQLTSFHKKQYSLIEVSRLNELLRGSWEAFGLTQQRKYITLDRKTRKKIDASNDHGAKYKTIDSLIAAIDNALQQNRTKHIIANLTAFDFFCDQLFKHSDDGFFISAFSPKWQLPMQNLVQSLNVAKDLTTIEYRNNALHYTTPDGWHCSFVQIKSNWYFYYQFDKTNSFETETHIPALPVVE